MEGFAIIIVMIMILGFQFVVVFNVVVSSILNIKLLSDKLGASFTNLLVDGQ